MSVSKPHDFATKKGMEWLNLQADAQQVQEMLNGMSDEQHMIIKVLAYRQTHVVLQMVSVTNIDLKSEAYQQQYNITVVSIVGDSILQSQEDMCASEQNQEQQSTNGLFDD